MRFAVFAGEDYYPSGGWADLHSIHPTIGEAEAEVESLSARSALDPYDDVDFLDIDWWNIVDLEDRVSVSYGRGRGNPVLGEERKWYVGAGSWSGVWGGDD